ncbi:MAG: hypothetical protein B6U65_02690 [Candidatus Wolframiiraptor sp. EX4484-121]|nr:MAG: hypothetical protein B6U65_02690 [Candidatus Wolframiiraptor sp. EX4484-121]
MPEILRPTSLGLSVNSRWDPHQPRLIVAPRPWILVKVKALKTICETIIYIIPGNQYFRAVGEVF